MLGVRYIFLRIVFSVSFERKADVGHNFCASPLQTNSGHSGHHLDFRFKQYCFHPHLQECISGVCRI